MQLKASGRKSD